MKDNNPIPVIDLFAGPGGLGEGFSRYPLRGKGAFHTCLSVEKDEDAHRTLELRAFFRQLVRKRLRTAKADYYSYITGRITREELFAKHPKITRHAEREALCAELGDPDDDKIVRRRVKELYREHKQEHRVLVGGPPCQAYSAVGRARNKGNADYDETQDERHTLYKEYLNILRLWKPSVFVMENVRGILSSKLAGEKIFPKILQDLRRPQRSLKYSIFSFVKKPDASLLSGPRPDLGLAAKDYLIRSELYGIPQRRHRVILFGIRQDLIKTCGFEALATLNPTKAPVSVGDMISSLPKVRSGSSEEDTLQAWLCAFDSIPLRKWKLKDKQLQQAIFKLAGKLRPYRRLSHQRGAPFIEDAVDPASLPPHLRRWLHDPRLDGVLNHETKEHMNTDIARYYFTSLYGKAAGRTPKLRDWPIALLPAHDNATSGDFADRFRVQLEHEPATTITSHISKDGHYFIHHDPRQCRCLTVREAARIQTFPDNYFFEGCKTQQYHQVGNAVPPYLAYQLAAVVHNLLKHAN